MQNRGIYIPTGVKNLLIVNGICFLAIVLFGRTGADVNSMFGLYQPAGANFKPYQFVTSIFLHGNLMHLFSNMFALWMFGSIIENVWGVKRFMFYYFFTAFGAAFLYLLVNQAEIFIWSRELVESGVPQNMLDGLRQANGMDEANAILTNMSISQDMLPTVQKFFWAYNTPCVGASGAVFGILLAYGMMYPNSTVYLYFALPVKTKWFVILYGAFELFAGISGVQAGVAHFAHVGGMLFGIILILYWKKRSMLYR